MASTGVRGDGVVDLVDVDVGRGVFVIGAVRSGCGVFAPDKTTDVGAMLAGVAAWVAGGMSEVVLVGLGAATTVGEFSGGVAVVGGSGVADGLGVGDGAGEGLGAGSAQIAPEAVGASPPPPQTQASASPLWIVRLPAPTGEYCQPSWNR